MGLDLPLTADLFGPDDSLNDLARRVDRVASEYDSDL